MRCPPGRAAPVAGQPSGIAVSRETRRGQRRRPGVAARRMRSRLKAHWVDLSESLAFLPAVMVALFAGLGVGLVELDDAVNTTGVVYVFAGDASAARTVLSVIAGSLITVAGLTFSITMIALQLTSSQFSPRILRTFFADRVTQLTIGAFVGTFVYALLVLRSVGTFGGTGAVPRIAVTAASVLGVAAVILLVVFLHHVAEMIQVSHIAGAIAHDTLRRLDVLYPECYGKAEDGSAALAHWRSEPPGRVGPPRPGYVRRVDLDQLADALAGHADRVAVLVCPGDLVSVDATLLEVWPAEAARCDALADAVNIGSERDLDQDVGFGVRQLADIALRAMSPGVNDPATAVTCIGYMRSILVRIAERELPPPLRQFAGADLTVYARRQEYDEYLDGLAQVGRSAAGDGWVAAELLQALAACAHAAAQSGAQDRARAAQAVADGIAEQALATAAQARDRETIAPLHAAVARAAAGPGRAPAGV
jgi:uncharacterized membrane protein